MLSNSLLINLLLLLPATCLLPLVSSTTIGTVNGHRNSPHLLINSFVYKTQQSPGDEILNNQQGANNSLRRQPPPLKGQTEVQLWDNKVTFHQSNSQSLLTPLTPIPVSLNQLTIVKRDIVKQEDGFIEGPSFVSLPNDLSSTNGQIDFYNSTGLTLNCKANGLPRPSIKWIKGLSASSSSTSTSNLLNSSLEVTNVLGLRFLRSEGSLVLQPFPADQFRPDIHLTSYRCIASNKVGAIVSPEFHVRAIIKESYSIQSSDEFVQLGNAGLIPCTIPSMVKDFVSVIHWQRSDGLIIAGNNLPSSESMFLLNDGSLFFDTISLDQTRWKYRCTVQDRLTGEQVNGLTWSKLIVTDSPMKSAPRMLGSLKDLWIPLGQDVTVGCLASADPIPSYYWFREETRNSVTLLKHTSSSPQSSSSSSSSSSLSTLPSPLTSLHSTGPILFLRSVQLHDSGTYVCLVNNSLGQDRLRFKLNVIEPLTVSMRPSQLYRRREGEPASIDCLIKPNRDHHMSLYTFEWLKDSKPLTFTSRISLTSRNKLRLLSVVREDRGMYQCIVKSEGASKQTAFASLHLHIEEEAPRLMTTFKSQLLEEGYSLSLKCSANGSPLPQIRWSLYHKTIDSRIHRSRYRIGDYVDTNGHIVSFLNVSSISREEGGLYSCTAYNDIGSSVYSAPISVLGPPMVHPMENVTILSSGRLSIDCPFSGHPIGTITWKKNGHPLPISRRVSRHSNGTLQLVDVHLDDQGWYRCEVSNGQETAQGSLYVHILEKPVINPFMFGADLTEGMRATVVCSILSGDPPLTFNWLKEGLPATSVHDDIEISSFSDSDSSFRIKSVKRSHSGNYTCIVSSSNISSNYTAEMIVKAPPRWVIKPEEGYSLLRGRNVVIDCQTDGYPQPTHQWKKVKTAIKPFDHSSRELIGIVSGPHIQVLENGSISIVGITKEDDGVYICESSNNVGPPLSATTRLTVHQPVRFNKNFELVEANKGDPVMLVCSVLGDHPITLSWVRDREAVLPFTGPGGGNDIKIEEERSEDGLLSKAVLSSVDTADSAFFTCQAQNVYGSDEKNIQLVVRGPPEPPVGLKAGETKSRAVSLSWLPTVNGNSPLLGYIVEYTTSNDTWTNSLETASVDQKDLSILITGLMPETMYRFRVIAQNALGRSQPSQEIIIRTEEEAPNEAPTNVRVEALSSRSLRIYWTNLGHNKRIDGYHIGYRKVTGFNSMRNSFDFVTFYLNETIRGLDELSYNVTELKRNTKYGLIVRPYNKKGLGVASEEVYGQTFEYDPPGEVITRVTGVTHRSLTIKIEGTNQENPISGFIVNYKSNTEDWEEIKILGTRTNFVLENLKCGTKYSISITPYNKAGPSPDTKMFHATTSGSVPSSGPLESLLNVNSTNALIDLSAWNENGCPILSFVVQYKQHFHTDWIMFSNNIMPSQGRIVITDLIPATWYDLLMIANSEPGTTEAQYLFATLTLNGGTIPPLTSTSYSTWELSFGDPVILAPILCAFIVFIVIFITIAILVSTKHQRADSSQETYNNNERNKMESLSMSSFALPVESSGTGKKNYETVQRKATYGSYYTSPYAANRVNFCEQEIPLNQHHIQRHTRIDSESHYDDLLTRNYRSTSPD